MADTRSALELVVEDKVSAPARTLTRNLKETTSAGEKLQSSILGISKSTIAAGAGVIGMGYGLSQLVGHIVSANKEFDQMEDLLTGVVFSFESWTTQRDVVSRLRESRDMAKDFVKQFEDLQTQLPLSLTTAIRTFRDMGAALEPMGKGPQEVIEVVGLLAKTAKATGVSLDQLGATVARLFAARLLPESVDPFATALRTTFREMNVEMMKVKPEVIFDVVMQQMQRFAPAAQDLVTDFGSQWEILKDMISDFLRDVGRPVFLEMTTRLQEMVRGWRENREEIAKVATEAGAGLLTVLRSFADMTSKILSNWEAISVIIAGRAISRGLASLAVMSKAFAGSSAVAATSAVATAAATTTTAAASVAPALARGAQLSLPLTSPGQPQMMLPLIGMNAPTPVLAATMSTAAAKTGMFSDMVAKASERGKSLVTSFGNVAGKMSGFVGILGVVGGALFLFKKGLEAAVEYFEEEQKKDIERADQAQAVLGAMESTMPGRTVRELQRVEALTKEGRLIQPRVREMFAELPLAQLQQEIARAGLEERFEAEKRALTRTEFIETRYRTIQKRFVDEEEAAINVLVRNVSAVAADAFKKVEVAGGLDKKKPPPKPPRAEVKIEKVEIKQEFRDVDPDRVFMRFKNDLEDLARNSHETSLFVEEDVGV